jgi:SAM-dependent methyltransferase
MDEATIELYGRLLEHAAVGEHDGRVCSTAGPSAPLPLRRWLAPADAADLLALEPVIPPVLDVGCGPGRVAAALVAAGRPGLGIDTSPAAVAEARRRGAPVLRRSVFDRVPGEGRWGAVLLLDGNVGIGGDPVALLARAARLLRPGGVVAAEVEPPGRPSKSLTVRVEAPDARPGPWFPWATVGADGTAGVAGAAGLAVAALDTGGGRWFARVVAP